MGIKQTTDLLSFIEPESQGFIYDTARSFLKRHSNPSSLLGQLKGLLHQGQLDACRDMIQLILREGHELADRSDIYLLRAQVAYEQAENSGEVMSWIQQAKICETHCPEIIFWDELMRAKTLMAEGVYQEGLKSLDSLKDNAVVGAFAKYEIANHLFWRNIDTDRALLLLEEVTMARPEFIMAWSCLGFVYNKLNMKSKAQNAFGNCLELDTHPERLAFYKQQLAS